MGLNQNVYQTRCDCNMTVLHVHHRSKCCMSEKKHILKSCVYTVEQYWMDKLKLSNNAKWLHVLST